MGKPQMFQIGVNVFNSHPKLQNFTVKD